MRGFFSKVDENMEMGIRNTTGGVALTLLTIVQI